MMNRNPEHTCSTCEWWEQCKRNGGVTGDCRVNAPIDCTDIWPITRPDQWCGQHSALSVTTVLESVALDREAQIEALATEIYGHVERACSESAFNDAERFYAYLDKRRAERDCEP